MESYREILTQLNLHEDADYIPTEFVDRFLTCVEKGQTGYVRIFLNTPLVSTFINTKDSNGRTALMLASMMDYLDIARMLLEAGCDKDATDSNGNTALILASNRWFTDIVKMLLDTGCDRNAKDSNGNNALMIACMYGRIETVRLLLEAKSERDEKNCYGETVLIIASRRWHTDIVGVLVEAGCDKDAKDNNGVDRGFRQMFHRYYQDTC